MKLRGLIYIVALCLGLAGCGLVKDQKTEAGPISSAVPGVSALPRARIYQIEPQWADLVPVAMSNGRLTSYPAVSDVSEATAPVALADGWWLDRAGIGPSTRFLRWTRSEYSAMKTTPTPTQIEQAVVGGARVKALVELPMTTSAALADTAAVNRLIAEGLPGCRELLNVFYFRQ